MMTDYSPAPPRLAVQAQTIETVKAEMNREAKQKQYDVAAKSALVVFKHHKECNWLAGIVGERSVEDHIPARIFAAMAIAESSCNPNAVSRTGDYGVWQVNARIHHINPRVLKDPYENAVIASDILRHCINAAGRDLQEGLHRYNGLGNPTNSYASAVMAIAYRRAS